jgi:cellulose synthase operon protein C
MGKRSRTACLAALSAFAPAAAIAQQQPQPAATTAPPATAATPAAPAPATASGNTALSILLRQASYWRDQNNPPRAEEAARRALLLSPNNVQALSILVQVQANAGDEAAAQQTLNTLRQAHPGDPSIYAAEQAVKVGAINPQALAAARALAKEGQTSQAVSAYHQIFNGASPPDSLSVEYYQTLAGAQNGYNPALSGLAAAATRDPNNLRAQLAYAQTLTYREDTRMQGISRLSILARDPQIGVQAQTAWRQAVAWLPADKNSIPAIEAYQTRYPNDPGIATLLAAAEAPPKLTPGAQAEADGFTALRANQLDSAEQYFQKALAANPQDASATGGIGLVMLRRGRSAEAATLFNRAIAMDPAQAPQWQQALEGAKQAQAGAALGGQYAAAANANARGDLPAAERAYRALLARQPGNAGIKMALAGVLAREGNQSEAQQLLTQVEQSGNGRLSDQARAQLLSQQAATMTDTAGQIALYRSAVASDPSSPWLRLDLARALVKNGQPAEAQQTMATVTDVPRPSNEALQAGIIFASETNNSAEATALISQLPVRRRTPQMQAIVAQAQVQGQIATAMSIASTDPGAARQQLFSLAAQRDPSGGRGLAVAQAFIKLADPADARAAIQTAAAANPTASNEARLSWAQGLLAAGDTAGASLMLSPLQTASLTPQQSESLTGLQRGIAIRSSDALNNAGRTADAYDQLSPALMNSPDDPALNAALARLYQTSDDPKKALAINEQILARDPTNVDARRGAVAAAIQAQDYVRASRLVEDSITASPNDPQNWILAADIAQARGLNQDALHDLRQARALRQQQLGFSQSAMASPFLVASNGPVSAPLGAVSNNPFRNSPDSGSVGGSGDSLLSGSGLIPGGTQTSFAVAAPSSTDPMLASIDTRITSIKMDVAPQIAASPEYQQRSGSEGLDQLETFSVPLEASFSPGGVGRLTLAATPTYLSAGSVGTSLAASQQFGSSVLGGPPPGSQTATGVGFGASYKADWLAADVGTTPLGFRITNVIGGIEVAPQLSSQVILRLTAERRAVTDSLLSYGGTEDPGTGDTWGGVTRTRVHGQLEFNPGVANFYAGGGYNWLNGDNVLSNTETELGAGGSYPVYKVPGDEVRVGLNLVYFGYQRNQDHFTLGYGGYFSPQSYVAALIPVTWSATRGKLKYSLGGSVGVQNFNADAEDVFPNNPSLQSQVVTLAASNPDIQSVYPSQSKSGVIGGLNGTFEYHLSPELVVGGTAGYQKSADWNETTAMGFARYTFASAD